MNDDGTVTVPLSWSERHEQVKAERDRLRAVVARYQRTYHVLDHALDDNDVDSVDAQFDDWKAAQAALLDTPTGDAKGAT